LFLIITNMLISAGEIIKKSFILYKENWKLLLKYVLLLATPIVIFSPLYLGMTATMIAGGTNRTLFIVYLALFIIVALCSMWFSLALLRVIATRYLGHEVQSMKQELKTSKHLVFPFIGVYIVFSLIIFGGLLLLIVPAIIWGVWYAFFTQTVALDEKKGLDALKKSRELVTGRWWSVFWRITAPAVVFMSMSLILQLVLNIPTLITESVGLLLAGFVLNIIANLLISPLSAIALTILFLELKKTITTTPIEVIPPAQSMEPPFV